jgi:hypothetical protein
MSAALMEPFSSSAGSTSSSGASSAHGSTAPRRHDPHYPVFGPGPIFAPASARGRSTSSISGRDAQNRDKPNPALAGR